MLRGHPFLAEAAVRDRLGLSAEQEKQLQSLARAYQEERKPSSDAEQFHRLQEARPTKGQVEAVLTPRQLTMLKEISFRKNRSWAIDVPHQPGDQRHRAAEGRVSTAPRRRVRPSAPH